MDVTTLRLHIRDLVEDDREPLHRLHTDPRVYRFNHFGPECILAGLATRVGEK